MQTRKRKWPSIEPWGTPVEADFHDDVFPFKITLWNLPEDSF